MYSLKWGGIINNKDKIADVAFVLAMKNGFDKVSIKQIQEESELTAGSIYYYFKDKDEILFYMVNKYLIDSFRKIKEKTLLLDGSFMEKIEYILKHGNSPIIIEDESLAVSDRFPLECKEFWVMYTSIYHHHPEIRPKFCELCEEAHDFYKKLILEAIEKNEIRDDIDIEGLIKFIKTIFNGSLLLMVFQPNLQYQKLVEGNMELLWEAVKRR